MAAVAGLLGWLAMRSGGCVRNIWEGAQELLMIASRRGPSTGGGGSPKTIRHFCELLFGGYCRLGGALRLRRAWELSARSPIAAWLPVW